MIEIISHCWRYSKALCYQLSSLYTWADLDNVQMTVCYSDIDKPTVEMLDWFSHLLPGTLNPLEFTPDQLLRRSIGRNFAAKRTEADIVWFCDADYYFGKGCLEALEDMVWADTSKIAYPVEVLANTTRELGDEYTNRIKRPALARICCDDFFPQRVKKAIGGLQIITGQVAKMGYLPDSKRAQRPMANGEWHPTTEDIQYRKSLGDMPIRLPNLYRIRQSVQGVCD